jgi:uncharacterized membrane protein
MAWKVLAVVFRTVIGLALVAGGVALLAIASKPDLMPSVQQGNMIIGPALICIGLSATFWPIAKYFHGIGPSGPNKRDHI